MSYRAPQHTSRSTDHLSLWVPSWSMALPQVQGSTPKYHSWNWIAVFARADTAKFIGSVRGPRQSGVNPHHFILPPENRFLSSTCTKDPFLVLAKNSLHSWPPQKSEACCVYLNPGGGEYAHGMMDSCAENGQLEALAAAFAFVESELYALWSCREWACPAIVWCWLL